MNQQNPIQIGRLNMGAVLTATDVGYSDSSEERLTQILRTLNYKNALITLARINLLCQLSDNPLENDNILRENFCSRHLRNKINKRKRLAGLIIFNRESTLRLLSKSTSVTDSSSKSAPDSTDDAKKKWANCYLISNESIGPNKNDIRIDSAEEERKNVLVKLISSLEYAITPSAAPALKKKLVRSKEFLERFQKIPSDFDVNATFSQATGLTLEEYQYLILGIVAAYLRVPPEKFLKSKVLCVDTKPSQDLTLLYEKLLPHTAIPIDELVEETLPALDNEFLLWRKHPLVKISEDQILCIDIGFLLDKVETGVFWIIRNQREREKKGEGKRIIDLRGEVFEDYVTSIIERGINAQIPSRMETCIIQPEYNQKQQMECTDIAVCGRETLILLECKALLLSAETKLSGDFCKFYNGIKHNAIKGIEQLWNAIQALGHTNTEERRKVEGIDIFRVKKIYPVLVLSDRIFSIPLMNWFLDSEFQCFKNCNNLEDHLKIMPLTVLTIEDLEFLEPYLSDTPFHVHLDKWITQFFKHSDSLPFNEYLRSLMEREVRQNTYMKQEFKKFSDSMKAYFSLQGIN